MLKTAFIKSPCLPPRDSGCPLGTVVARLGQSLRIPDRAHSQSGTESGTHSGTPNSGSITTKSRSKSLFQAGFHTKTDKINDIQPLGSEISQTKPIYTFIQPSASKPSKLGFVSQSINLHH